MGDNLAAINSGNHGRTETLGYDTRNRNTSTSWDDGITPSTVLGYDYADHLTSFNNANSALAYSYADDGAVLSETQTVSGLAGAKTVSYAYNATTGLLGTLTYVRKTVKITGGSTLAVTASVSSARRLVLISRQQ